MSETVAIETEPPLKRRKLQMGSLQSTLEVDTSESIPKAKSECDLNLIAASDVVAILDSNGQWHMLHMGAKTELKLGRHRGVDASNLLGQPYGVSFNVLRSADLRKKSDSAKIIGEASTRKPFSLEVSPGSHWALTEEKLLIESMADESAADSSTAIGSDDAFIGDNRELYDSNTSQTLTQSTVLELKSTITGDDLVSKLVGGSQSFKKKTAFSKQKYIAKKRRKHAVCYLTSKMTADILCRVYWAKKPDKSLALRSDSLAQLMHFGNVHSGQSVLCVDETHGIVAANCAERMDGNGRVLVPYFGAHPILHAAYDLAMLSSKQRPVICSFHVALLKGDDDDNSGETVATEVTDTSIVALPKEDLSLLTDPSSKPKDLDRPSLATVRKWLFEEQCDSLIVATKHDALDVFTHCWPCVAHGANFVVWSHRIEELAAIHAWLDQRESARKDCAAFMKCHDNWLRPYQVLPRRTHPVVNMEHCGGYFLTGIKVFPPIISHR